MLLGYNGDVGWKL